MRSTGGPRAHQREGQQLQRTLTSRRQFLQWASGVASAASGIAWASDIAPGGTGPLGQVAHRPAADLDSAAKLVKFGDASIRLTFDTRLRSGVAYLQEGHAILLAPRGVSEFVELADGQHVEDFTLGQRSTEPVSDVHGTGTQLTLVGIAPQGLQKTVRVRLYDRYPGFAIYRVSYRNLSERPISLNSWTNGAFVVHGSGPWEPRFWSYSGSTYPDRRDWVQPVKKGFAQENFLGMTSSDYGGGTPIADVWRRDCGLAVGHLELKPRLLSLPVKEVQGTAHIRAQAQSKQVLAPGESFDTLETFVAAHPGDHFATLDSYRRLMGERGLRAAVPPEASYEPIWCAWGYERNCTVELIEGTLPKVKDLGLAWAVIDDGWQSSVGDWKLHPQNSRAAQRT